MLEIQTIITYERVKELHKFHAWYKNRIINVLLPVTFFVLGAHIASYQQKIILGISFIIIGSLCPLLNSLICHLLGCRIHNIIALTLSTLVLGSYIIFYQQETLGTIFILAGFLFTFLLIFPWMMDKIVDRNRSFKENIHYFFELDNKNFNCTSTRGQEETKFTTEWNGIIKIYETKKNFYIYKSNREVYSILKEDCLSNIEKLRQLFTEVLGNKFKKFTQF